MKAREQAEDLALGFGRNLLRLRRRAGLSQEEVAARAALHRTEIGLLENGVRLPRLDTILKVAGAIGEEPCDLLDGMAWESTGFKRGRFCVWGRGTPPLGGQAGHEASG
jgi:transcriptional regulator with XRE-family HTH domain